MQAVTITQITPQELINIINEAVAKALSQYRIPTIQPDPWMNLDELMAYLPDKPAKQTIYQNIDKYPHHKKGKKLYFLKSEIDIWLAAGRRTTFLDAKVRANQFLTNQ